MTDRGEIRELDHTDTDIAHDIWRLFQLAYRTEAEIIGVSDFPPLDRTVEEIQNCKSCFFGLFGNGTLLSAAETRMDGMVLSIEGLVVDPKCFMRGYGSRLLKFILEKSHCESSVVETAEINEPALRLYRKFGFRETGRRETPDGIRLVRLNLCSTDGPSGHSNH